MVQDQPIDLFPCLNKNKQRYSTAMFGKLLKAGSAALSQPPKPAVQQARTEKAETKTNLRSSLTSLLQSGLAQNVLEGLSPAEANRVIDDQVQDLPTEAPSSSCQGNKKSLFVGKMG